MVSTKAGQYHRVLLAARGRRSGVPIGADGGSSVTAQRLGVHRRIIAASQVQWGCGVSADRCRCGEESSPQLR